QKASREFAKAGDEVRAALMRANSFWIQLLQHGPGVEFGIDEIRVAKFALSFSNVDQHRITIALTEALWFVMKGHRAEAMAALEELSGLRESQQLLVTAEVAVEIAAIYLTINANEQAEVWFSIFQSIESDSDSVSAGVATLRLAAEVSEKLGKTDEALRYWRQMAIASSLVGHGIFESTGKFAAAIARP
ncbi:MAG: hypothetical protein CGW95_16850, partial [Phenylobacterium zucineum]